MSRKRDRSNHKDKSPRRRGDQKDPPKTPHIARTFVAKPKHHQRKPMILTPRAIPTR